MSPARKKFILFVILFIAFIDIMGIALVYPMFSTMLFNRELSIVSADTLESVRGVYLGVLLALMPLTQFFSSPLFGMLSDSRGRRGVLIGSLAVGIAGYALAILGVNFQSLALLFISRIVVGISAGSAAVLSASLADLCSEEEKAKKFGLLNMAYGVGFAFGPFIGGKLADFGLAVPFWVTGLAVALNLAFVLFFYPETLAIRKKVSLTWNVGIANLKKGFQLPGLKAIFLGSFFCCLGWSFFWEFISVTWIADYGMGPGEIGQFYAYGGAIYAVSSGLLIAPFVGRFQPQVVLFFSLALLGPYILLSLIHFPKEGLWIYMPLQQYLLAFFFPTAAAFVSNRAGKDIQGEVLGILQSVESFAFAASPLIAGGLLALSKDAPVFVGGLSMITGAAVLGVLLRKEIFRKDKIYL